jgi:hypothetical protein
VTDAELPEELARLEQSLARRALPEAPAGLRPRALGPVRRARARERNLLLAAAAAVVVTVGTLGRSMPGAERAAPGEEPAHVQAEAQALERIGLASADARRLLLVAHAARLQPLAPPVGSGAAAFPIDGGR